MEQSLVLQTDFVSLTWFFSLLILKTSHSVCYSHYLQWAPVPLSRGVLIKQHKASLVS